MSDVKPIPDSYPRVSPHLSIAGAAEAIDYYRSVLGATERMRMAMPDGTVAHAELQLGDSVIMIGDEAAGATDGHAFPRYPVLRRLACWNRLEVEHLRRPALSRARRPGRPR
jgi:uncharacterized glyoxalase superfamily protein PhnB